PAQAPLGSGCKTQTCVGPSWQVTRDIFDFYAGMCRAGALRNSRLGRVNSSTPDALIAVLQWTGFVVSAQRAGAAAARSMDPQHPGPPGEARGATGQRNHSAMSPAGARDVASSADMFVRANSSMIRPTKACCTWRPSFRQTARFDEFITIS